VERNTAHNLHCIIAIERGSVVSMGSTHGDTPLARLMQQVGEEGTRYLSRDPLIRSFEIALGAAALTVAGAGIWYYLKESYYTYVPLCYQYRPGTMTGYFSKVLAKHAKRRRRYRPIRVYMDGCFDLMHYGHANALRQAATLGDELVVGLVPDREILRCKGPPLLNEDERLELVESVKWVDEVLTGVPYDLTPEFLDELFTKHRIDYVIHGDDPCILPDGTDAYAYAKKSGRFRMIKRTEGVSTTDIVGRMLMCSRNNSRFVHPETRDLTKMFSMGHERDLETESNQSYDEEDIVQDINEQMSKTEHVEQMTDEPSGATPRKAAGVELEARPITVSRFMPTSRRIVQFSSGKVAPPGSKIVYIDGAFDLFHVGHVEILKAARQEGDFLLVGVHTDEDVTKRRGAHLPIMELHERALSVLACRYTDEVIIGAPSVITDDLLTTFNISLVVRGSMHEISDRNAASESERYLVPSNKDCLRYLKSPSNMTSAELIQRIVKNREQFEDRQAKKTKSEAAYYTSSKHYVTEI
jgi:ethanolamine-phosphate cytidylyltransferase